MIEKALRKITNDFETGFSSSTLLGWERNYDNEGRPLRANPNYRSGVATIDDVQYSYVRKEWLVRIWDRNANYGDFMSNKTDYILEIDLTPDYVKEYYAKKHTTERGD